MEHFDFLRVIEFLPGIIIGLTVHEFSHAFVADKCGDSTSKEQGRITLNPFKHIDILGFIMLLLPDSDGLSLFSSTSRISGIRKGMS